VGTGGGADGLGGYLGAQIPDQLDQADREFLISTSVLQEVGVDSAVALGIDDAAGRLASLRSAPIPAQWS
jgi:ATP/maltotriose-dependent transcriptional regulator MalT